MKILIVISVLTVVASAAYAKGSRRIPPPKSFLCPPNFVRTKHNKCYYFSRTAENFDHAYWKCADNHATLAVIRGKNQDNTLRRLLNRNKIEHVERWIGARYNWEKIKWQWAASGKLVNYTGFENGNSSYETWQCIVLDPKIQYKWNVRSCFEKKHYICQTRIKKTNVISPHDHNTTKYDKTLNEIPIPEVSNNDISTNWNKQDNITKNSDSNVIGNIAFASRPKPQKRGKGKGRKGKGRKKKTSKKLEPSIENAQQDAPAPKEGFVNMKPKKLKWVTYHGASSGPNHPRIIVEDFDFQRNETAG